MLESPYEASRVLEFFGIVVSEFYGYKLFSDIGDIFTSDSYEASLLGICTNSETARSFIDLTTECVLSISNGRSGLQGKVGRKRLRGRQLVLAMMEVMWILHIQGEGHAISAYFGSF